MPSRFPTPQHGVIQQMARSFQRATGLPLQFHQPGEYHVSEEEAVPPFCRLLARSSRTCQTCRQTHLDLQDPEGRQTRTSVCFAGLTSSAVPVRCGEKVLGYLHTGHASVEAPACCEQPGQSCRISRNRQRGRTGCAGACRSTPEISRERYEGAVEMLGLLAEKAASSPVTMLPGGAYPAIERAIEVLRSDATRGWKLAEIARHVGMHPGYFSERFHQHAGVTFGQFVAGLRVERARHLLEFTALPVSEVAFASGFRSLSQFNRTFKNLTGQVPGKMFRRPSVLP